MGLTRNDLVIGEFYYYGNNDKKFKCVDKGEIQSYFTDDDDETFLLHNKDMSLFKFVKKQIKWEHVNGVDVGVYKEHIFKIKLKNYMHPNYRGLLFIDGIKKPIYCNDAKFKLYEYAEEYITLNKL